MEWPAARQHFVEHDAEGPDVGAFVHGLAARLLRSHVGGGAEDHAVARRRLLCRRTVRVALDDIVQPGQAEVQDLDPPIGRGLDVRRFEIAVDDAAVVRRLQRVGDLPGERQRFVDRDRRRANAVGERRTVNQLHHEIVGPDVVQRADVRMVERGDGAGLPLEAVAEAFGRHLDCDVPAEAGIARAIHRSHAAGSECADDLVGAQSGPRRHCARAYANSACYRGRNPRLRGDRRPSLWPQRAARNCRRLVGRASRAVTRWPESDNAHSVAPAPADVSYRPPKRPRETLVGGADDRNSTARHHWFVGKPSNTGARLLVARHSEKGDDMESTSIVDSVKNGIIGAIKGTGEILNAVIDTVSDVLGNTLTSAGAVGSAATGAVSEVARGVIQGTSQVGGDLGQAAKGMIVGMLRGTKEVGGEALHTVARASARWFAKPPRWAAMWVARLPMRSPARSTPQRMSVSAPGTPWPPRYRAR